MANIIGDIIEQLHRNAILMKRNMHHHHFEAQAANHSSQAKILVILTRNQGISQKALSELLHIRPQSLGELLLKLENAQMIKKVQNSYDKRVINIFLTEKGLNEAGKISDAGTEVIESLFDAMSEDELQSFLDLLTKLNDSIELKLTSDNPEDGNGPEHERYFRGDCEFHNHRGCHGHSFLPPPDFFENGAGFEYCKFHRHHGHHHFPVSQGPDEKGFDK